MSKWNKDNIPNQKGKTVIITGATSGLGKAATKVLADKNATVIMAVRNTKKGKIVAEKFNNDLLDPRIEVRKLDLASLDSIQSFSEGIKASYEHLDILINNAGVMTCPYSKTEDGFEIQMGTNHLGHFALTGLLMPLLKKTKRSRVVQSNKMSHNETNAKRLWALSEKMTGIQY